MRSARRSRSCSTAASAPARTSCARIALGARACLSGRAYIYGLGAGGQAGVARAIEIMRNELGVSMALTGVTSIAEIDRRVIAADVASLSVQPADRDRRIRGEMSE